MSGGFSGVPAVGKQSGRVTYGVLAANATAVLAVTFPVEYGAIPDVDAISWTTGGTSKFLLSLAAITTAGATITATNVTGVAGTLMISWTATP